MIYNAFVHGVHAPCEEIRGSNTFVLPQDELGWKPLLNRKTKSKLRFGLFAFWKSDTRTHIGSGWKIDDTVEDFIFFGPAIIQRTVLQLVGILMSFSFLPSSVPFPRYLIKSLLGAASPSSLRTSSFSSFQPYFLPARAFRQHGIRGRRVTR